MDQEFLFHKISTGMNSVLNSHKNISTLRNSVLKSATKTFNTS